MIDEPLASGLPMRKLAFHASATLFVPYLYTRLRNHALSHAWPDTPSSDRRRRMWDILRRLETFHSAAALLSFVVFLWNGRPVFFEVPGVKPFTYTTTDIGP